MDAELFRYGLSISKKLDERFNKTTVAAKMTDVPGHTIAMVPELQKAGVEYLHIGVNESSRVPDVPVLFRWRCRGHEIVVNYAGSYGQATLLDNGAALQFCHGADNARPPSEAELDALYASLKKQYPNAEISAGTLDDFVPYVREVRTSLPAVESEIGDTWIHGAASDPYKVSRFMRLLAMKDEWIRSGALRRDSRAYETFMENLLLVTEHTWGMDTKKFLLDFSNWEKADFARARKADRTSYALFSPVNKHIFEALLPELRAYRGENEQSSYSLFEASHEEQRAYVDEAIRALPLELAKEAQRSFMFSVPKTDAGRPVYPDEPTHIGDRNFVLGNNGEIRRISSCETGADKTVELGLFEYQTFDAKTVDECLYSYGRDMDKNRFWAECDFGKPGLKYHENLKSGIWQGVYDGSVICRGRLTVRLLGEREACEEYGCPREIVITHTFLPHCIKTELYWRGKDAIRSPEAIWMHFNPNIKGVDGWYFEKLGTLVPQRQVVTGGNRRLACARRIVCKKTDSAAELVSIDAPVVSVGEKSLYRADDKLPDPSCGFYFLLYNNRWGTNFKQWFEEDMRFSFISSICGITTK
jgi:hypothetical protein